METATAPIRTTADALAWLAANTNEEDTEAALLWFVSFRQHGPLKRTTLAAATAWIEQQANANENRDLAIDLRRFFKKGS